MEEEKTTIAISRNLWKQLNDYRVNPQESFEDVIRKFINKKEVNQNDTKNN